jgi:hypothetical protein
MKVILEGILGGIGLAIIDSLRFDSHVVAVSPEGCPPAT